MPSFFRCISNGNINISNASEKPMKRSLVKMLLINLFLFPRQPAAAACLMLLMMMAVVVVVIVASEQSMWHIKECFKSS